MKKLLALSVGLAFVTGSLLAQATGGSSDKASEGKKGTKSEKKGHKGGKKSKKGSEGTTTPPK